MNSARRYSWLTPLFIAALVLGGCESSGAETQACNTVTDIEGVYACSGECVVTDSTGTRILKTVTGETDTVERYPGSNEGLYQVSIIGRDTTGTIVFRELEIGVLVERTMRTATADVSDGQYPVLEEYIFETDPACQATRFTKVVRNPSEDNFKSCVILCDKSNP